MLDLSPKKQDLDPIEMASRDEIAALQLKRLKWTLRHVYDNVPHYWKKFDQAGVHPDDLNSLDDLAKFPFTTKEDLRSNYPFGLFAVPMQQIVRTHASSRHDRQADCGGLHQGRHRHLGGRRGAVDSRVRRQVRHARACLVRLRAVHRRPRRALRCRAARLHDDSGLGRHDRAAGAADLRLRARHHHGDAELYAGHPGRVPKSRASTHARPRSKSASSGRNHGPMPCARRSSRRSTCTPSTSTACRR